METKLFPNSYFKTVERTGRWCFYGSERNWPNSNLAYGDTRKDSEWLFLPTASLYRLCQRSPGFSGVENPLVSLNSCGFGLFSNWDGADLWVPHAATLHWRCKQSFLPLCPLNCSFLAPNGLLVDPHRLWMDLCRKWMIWAVQKKQNTGWDYWCLCFHILCLPHTGRMLLIWWVLDVCWLN